MKAYRYLLSTCLTLCLMGCAGFRGNRLPRADGFSQTDLDTKRIPFSASFTAKVKFGKIRTIKGKGLERLKKEFLDVLDETGRFIESANPQEESGLKFEVDLLNFGSPAALIPAFITGYSLWTVPSWVSDNYKVKVIVQKESGQFTEYTAEDKLVTVEWLPMVLFLPFKFPPAVSIDIRKNMYRTIIKKMEEDEMF